MSYAKNILDSGKLGTTTKLSSHWSKANQYRNQFNVIDDQVVEVKDVVVHTFMLGDVDDPDLYAAEPMFDWERSEAGQWIMAHAVEQPVWHRTVDPVMYGYKYKIKARLKAVDYTFWALKWNSAN